MDNESFEHLIRDNLDKYQQADAKNIANARYIRKSLKLWNRGKAKHIGSFLDWWKEQDLQRIVALQSYLSYLANIEKKIDLKLFEDIYYALTPILSRSSTMRVVITSDNLDEPNIEGGFLKDKFSIFQYDFSPSNHELQVTNRDEAIEKPYTLDFILDFLSFLVNKAGEGFLGFRRIPSSEWVSSETALIHSSLGPEVKVAFPDYDFRHVEKGLKQLKDQDEESDSFLARLLHVRHRALLESNLESRLITLWAFIEDLWAEEETDDKLLTHEESEKIRTALKNSSVPPEKLQEVMNVISVLKKKSNTKHAKITEQIIKLESGKGWDIEKTKKVHRMRSKFAHGNRMKPDQEQDVRHYISFLMEILNELIAKEFSIYDIAFS
jgi:hypothetical protein